MNLKYIFISFCVICIFFLSCNEDDTLSPFLHFSLPENVVVGALNNDTVMVLYVKSSENWSVKNESDWCSLSHTTGGEMKYLELQIQKNNSINLRTHSFEFVQDESKKTYQLTISQLPAGDYLSISPTSVELSSISRDTDIIVISNIPLTSHIEYDTDEFFSVTKEQTGTFEYKFKLRVAENSTPNLRTGKLIIEGTGGAIHKDTVGVLQYYPIEELAFSGRNDENGCVVSWSKSIDNSVQYYELHISSPDGSIHKTVDISSINNLDINSLEEFSVASPAYVGYLQIKLIAKVQASSEKISSMGKALVTVHTHFSDGDGSESNPYQIANYRHFLNFGKAAVSYKSLLSDNFIQTSDIILPNPVPEDIMSNFTIIGTSASSFNGQYDGKGFKISNVHKVTNQETERYLGLFASIGKNGVVKQLQVKISRLEGQSNIKLVGGITALNLGTISRCSVEAMDATSVIYSKNNAPGYSVDGGNLAYNGMAGGIAGGNEGTISHCNNQCTLVTLFSAGGIVGGVHRNVPTAKIEYCYNTGDIYAGYPGEGITIPGGIVHTTAQSHRFKEAGVGGIGGRMNYLNAATPATIYSCFNTGNIYSDENCGGIAGLLYHCKVENCFNSGDIVQSRYGGTTHTGGVIGWMTSNNTSCSVKTCYNSGNIRYVQSGSSGYAGGVIGSASSANSTVVISDVVFYQNPEEVQLNYAGFIHSSNISTNGKRISDPEQMKSLENFYSSYSPQVWEIKSDGYLFPQLISIPYVERGK